VVARQPVEQLELALLVVLPEPPAQLLGPGLDELVEGAAPPFLLAGFRPLARDLLALDAAPAEPAPAPRVERGMEDLRAHRDAQQGHASRSEPVAVPAQERGLVVALEREVDEPLGDLDLVVDEAVAGRHRAAALRNVAAPALRP
jgi:hypothetical protein